MAEEALQTVEIEDMVEDSAWTLAGRLAEAGFSVKVSARPSKWRASMKATRPRTSGDPRGRVQAIREAAGADHVDCWH